VATSAVSATKMDTPLLGVPQAVTVLPAARIQDLRPLVLNEVLHQVAGVADTGSRRGFDFPNIRGFDASASNVFLDGLRVERGNFNVPQELSALARVEVLKGPAAMLFGQGPPGGIVNQISHAPSDRPVVLPSPLLSGCRNPMNGRRGRSCDRFTHSLDCRVPVLIRLTLSAFNGRRGYPVRR
jgi:outer membrane receptor for monomeric catechols